MAAQRPRSRTRWRATASSSAPPAPSSPRSATSIRTSVTRAGRGAVRRLESPSPFAARAVAPLRPSGAGQRGAHARQGERRAARAGSTCSCATTTRTSRRWCSPTTCSAASSTARMPGRVREKEGLSYSTFSSFNASALDEAGSFRVGAIFAPQNRSRVETRDPRGARTRGARRLHRRGGQGRQAGCCSSSGAWRARRTARSPTA